jgi:response regulator RpfG family c-di-GMP phosphodiesterase
MKKNILILETNDFEREKLKINLGNIGKFSFKELSNPKDFFLMEQNLEDFSLIIMDLEFPTTSEGYKVLNQISLNPSLSLLPIIIISKEKTSYNKSKVMQDYNVKDYIIKPYTHDRLLNSINLVIPVMSQFFYSFENARIISMPVEEFITQQLNISSRVEKPLSIIYITPNYTELHESNKITTFNNSKDKIFNILLKYIKLCTRTTDIVLLVNEEDIVVLLHCSNSDGSSNVVKKIKTSVNSGLSEFGYKFDVHFYLSSVTFPDEGKDIETLMNSVIKKINNKSALDKIVSASKHKFNQANLSYKKLD